MRSVHIQKDKTVFKLSELPAEEYAASMGLPGAPQIKLLDQKKKLKARGPAEEKEVAVVQEREVVGSDESDEEEDDDDDGEDEDESGSDEGDTVRPEDDADEDNDEDDSESSDEERAKVSSHIVLPASCPS